MSRHSTASDGDDGIAVSGMGGIRPATRRRSSKYLGPSAVGALASLAMLASCPVPVYGWGNSNGDTDETIYASSFSRDWLTDSTAISIKLLGCVWGLIDVNNNAEDMACMDNESEDGTTYWYQMSGCRRGQVAFSLHATDSSNSVGCGSSTHMESFMTKDGLAEFIYYATNYDDNSPFGNGDGDDNYGDDNGGDDGDDGYGDEYDDLPVCEEGGNYGYLSVGCADDGTFAINEYSDQYCLNYAGTYSSLTTLNKILNNYRNCWPIYDSSSGISPYNALPYQLVKYSEPCSSLDSTLCTDSESLSSRRSSTSKSKSHRVSVSGAKWVNKLKYGLGGLFLVASFIMFMGILFTNRRKRRALMQRKFRQSASKSYDDKEGRARRKKSRSKSRSRRDDEARSKSSRRSKSKRSKSKDRRTSERERRSERVDKEENGEGGVFT